MQKLTSLSDKDRKTKLTESRSSSSTLHKETAIRIAGAGPAAPGHAHSPQKPTHSFTFNSFLKQSDYF